jgi:hypothetical protein
MGVVVQYDYAAWQNQFPALASVASNVVQSYWIMAEAFHANDGGGPIQTASLQTVLMNLMAAHLLVLFNSMIVNPDGSINSGLVGRISSTSEGSVSVSTENQYPPGTDQWYQQTQFGSAYWAATSQFRRMSYRAPPRRRFNPPLVGPGWPNGFNGF